MAFLGSVFLPPQDSQLAYPFPCLIETTSNGMVYRLYPPQEAPLFSRFKPFDYNYLAPIPIGARRGGKEGHYHLHKHEIFFLIEGEIILFLKDVLSQRTEKIKMTDLNSPPLYLLAIPPKISHLLLNQSTKPALLLVYANQPPSPEDEIPYSVFEE